MAAAVLRIWPSGTLPAGPAPGCCAAGIAEAIAATASTTSERGSAWWAYLNAVSHRVLRAALTSFNDARWKSNPNDERRRSRYPIGFTFQRMYATYVAMTSRTAVMIAELFSSR